MFCNNNINLTAVSSYYRQHSGLNPTITTFCFVNLHGTLYDFIDCVLALTQFMLILHPYLKYNGPSYQ